MTFEEFWKGYDPDGVNTAADRALARYIWDSAVAAERDRCELIAVDIEKAAIARERERCAKLCEEWVRGAAVVNAAEGRPIDPRQDIETAGDQLAEAIRRG